jgi:inosine-uridine nucleoside N-ribohydrolase
MKNLRYFHSVFLLSVVLTSTQFAFAQKQKPVPVIFDSDMGPDYDDVGAITMLHAFADSGKVKILATIASTKYDGVAAVFDVFNTYFKRPDIPVGVPKGQASVLKDFQHWTDSVVAKYPHSIKQNSEVPDAIEVYRKVLSSAQDQSVTIVTVGFLTNLSGLLESKPDKHSKLNGKDLVQKKVQSLVCMAGGFPNKFKEFNIHIDAAASRNVFTNWPTSVLFSGFEIGVKIKSGLPLVNNASIKNSPVKDVFRISIPQDKNDAYGRCSWDETAVLIAVNGYKPYYRVQEGRIVVAEDGSNTWDSSGKGQFYIVEDKPFEVVVKVINDMIMHQPGKGSTKNE